MSAPAHGRQFRPRSSEEQAEADDRECQLADQRGHGGPGPGGPWTGFLQPQ